MSASELDETTIESEIFRDTLTIGERRTAELVLSPLPKETTRGWGVVHMTLMDVPENSVEQLSDHTMTTIPVESFKSATRPATYDSVAKRRQVQLNILPVDLLGSARTQYSSVRIPRPVRSSLEYLSPSLRSSSYRLQGIAPPFSAKIGTS